MSLRRPASTRLGGTAPSLKAAGAAIAALALGACTMIGDVTRPVGEKVGFATTVPKAPDFLEQSRMDAPSDFIPVGLTPPDRGDKPMTPEQLKEAEADLQSTLMRHDTLGGLPPPTPGDPKAAKKPPPKMQGEKLPASQ